MQFDYCWNSATLGATDTLVRGTCISSFSFFFWTFLVQKENSKVQEFQWKNTPYKLGQDQNWKEESQRNPFSPHWCWRWAAQGRGWGAVTLGKRIHQLGQTKCGCFTTWGLPFATARQAGARRMVDGIRYPRARNLGYLLLWDLYTRGQQTVAQRSNFAHCLFLNSR